MKFARFLSNDDRRLLGIAPLSGPTPWLVAIMSFSILIVAAAGLALANNAAMFANAVEARYSLEVPAASTRAQSLEKMLQATPGVTNVEAVTEEELRGDLRKWLGPLASNRDLPVPALINFDLDSETRLDGLRRRLANLEPEATIEAHRAAVGPILKSLRTLQWVAFALVLLLAGAAAAAIVLSARAALDTHRAAIQVLHGIGATDGQITRLLQRKIMIDALAGSLAGAAVATIILLMLAAGAAFLGDLTGGASLGTGDLLLLALVPLLLTALATGVARFAVLARLRETL